jgi:selenide,water dikinase
LLAGAHEQSSTRLPKTDATARLTTFSHGGGCGCKVAPGQLAEILKTSGAFALPPQLLVGIETGDDAAVYQIDERTAIVATTDFFMPIVDDAFDFGRIAATNAISDVYAMGGSPIFALAVVGMPIDRLPADTIRLILKGGETVCHSAGIPIVGGHTIDCIEPVYGLVVIGLVDPKRIRRNCTARTGDVLVLGKSLGVGILSAALKKGRLDADGYKSLMATTTMLNTPGRSLAGRDAVHAMTDVTGFGLLGHLLEMCEGAKLSATIEFKSVPILNGVKELAAEGFLTAASARNWRSYGDKVYLSPNITKFDQALLTDPQTSGGLLVACAPNGIDDVLGLFRREGFSDVAVIGRFETGDPSIVVT